MHTRVEDRTIKFTLELSIRPDEARPAGYFVVENDGPDHTIQWGPMPYSLVQAFMRERAEVMQKSLETVLNQTRTLRLADLMDTNLSTGQGNWK